MIDTLSAVPFVLSVVFKAFPTLRCENDKTCGKHLKIAFRLIIKIEPLLIEKSVAVIFIVAKNILIATNRNAINVIIL